MFAVVADCYGAEREVAGPGVHAVVGEDSVDLEVIADDHPLHEFDLQRVTSQTMEQILHFTKGPIQH